MKKKKVQNHIIYASGAYYHQNDIKQALEDSEIDLRNIDEVGHVVNCLLVKDVKNKYDHNAIAITYRGYTLAYVPKDLTNEVSSVMPGSVFSCRACIFKYDDSIYDLYIECKEKM